MKIKISELEQKLNKKIKRNFKSIGIDTAQISGVCFLTTDDVYLHIDSIILSFKTKERKEIYQSIVKTFEKIFADEDVAIIEDVFIGFNRAGSLELSRYGSFAIAECIKKDISYEIISAVSARAKFKINTQKYGKGKSKLAVSDFVNDLDIKLTDNNAVDAFVLALLGICENIEFKKTVKKKRVSKPIKRKKKK